VSFPRRVAHKLRRGITGEGLEAEVTVAYRMAIRRYRLKAVLAEYGDTGAGVTDACRMEQVPLVVHFHGYDASQNEVLAVWRAGYQRMFREAAALVAVSRAMREKLAELGAPPDRVHLNPYGVDCDLFDRATPETCGPVFVAVGRFTEKKAPALTLQAFARVVVEEPSARLRMIGDGPLLSSCQALAGELGLDGKVEFMGPRPPIEVAQALREARCFVQHSLIAPSGDSEGTPVAIIEAQAAGLPVVSTRHAGIPDVVVEGKTGFLVEEQDVEAMAGHMLGLAASPELAAKMGQAGRELALSQYSQERSIAALWRIMEIAMERGPAPR